MATATKVVWEFSADGAIKVTDRQKGRPATYEGAFTLLQDTLTVGLSRDNVFPPVTPYIVAGLTLGVLRLRVESGGGILTQVLKRLDPKSGNDDPPPEGWARRDIAFPIGSPGGGGTT
jgi:hypothetical protein